MSQFNTEIYSDRIVPSVKNSAGESILIVGTAQDGPDDQVIAVNNAEEVSRFYGPSSYTGDYKNPIISGTADGKKAGATILTSVKQAIDEGVSNVRVFRVGGRVAQLAAGGVGTGLRAIVFKAIYSGAIYNQFSVALAVASTDYTFTIVQPTSKGGTITIGPIADTQTVENMIDTFNAASTWLQIDKNYAIANGPAGWMDVTLAVAFAATATLAVFATSSVAGGTNGCLAPGDTDGGTSITAAGGRTIAFDSTASTITLSSGSLHTDGYVQGQQITVAGSATSGNNQNYTILSINTGGTVMVVSPTPTTVAAASATVTISTGIAVLNGMEKYVEKLVLNDSGAFDTIIGAKPPVSAIALTGVGVDDQICTAGKQKNNAAAAVVWTSTEAYSYSIKAEFEQFMFQYCNEIQPAQGFLGVKARGPLKGSALISYATTNLLGWTSATDSTLVTPGYYSQNQRWLKAGPFLTDGGRFNVPNYGTIDMGSFVTISGESAYFFDSEIGEYECSCVVPVAAKYCTTVPERSFIRQYLNSPSRYNPVFPGKYGDKLGAGVGNSLSDGSTGGGGYVVFSSPTYETSSTTPMIGGDPNAALRDSGMGTTQSAHLVNNIGQNLKIALLPFISQPANDVIKTAMSTAVRNVLDRYATTNGLRGGEGVGYKFKIFQSNKDLVLGHINLELELWLAYAITSITTRIFVRQ